MGGGGGVRVGWGVLGCIGVLAIGFGSVFGGGGGGGGGRERERR